MYCVALSETKKIREAEVALTVSGRAMRAAVYLSHMYQKSEEPLLFLSAATTAVLASDTDDFVRRWQSLEIKDLLRFTDRVLVILKDEFIVASVCKMKDVMGGCSVLVLSADLYESMKQ